MPIRRSLAGRKQSPVASLALARRDMYHVFRGVRWNVPWNVCLVAVPRFHLSNGKPLMQRSHEFGRASATARSLVALGGILLTTVLLGGGPAPRKAASPPPSEASNPTGPNATSIAGPNGDRLREGSKIVDEIGHFELQGDRATFISTSSKRKLGCLENLGLERIAQVVSDNAPNQLEWTVNGIVTEYRGSNYVLISEAILKTKPSRAAN